MEERDVVAPMIDVYVPGGTFSDTYNVAQLR
jgi:hypothetical protein